MSVLLHCTLQLINAVGMLSGFTTCLCLCVSTGEHCEEHVVHFKQLFGEQALMKPSTVWGLAPQPQTERCGSVTSQHVGETYSTHLRVLHCRMSSALLMNDAEVQMTRQWRTLFYHVCCVLSSLPPCSLHRCATHSKTQHEQETVAMHNICSACPKWLA